MNKSLDDATISSNFFNRAICFSRKTKFILELNEIFAIRDYLFTACSTSIMTRTGLEVYFFISSLISIS